MREHERESVVENIVAAARRKSMELLEAALESAHPAQIADAMRLLKPRMQEQIMDLLSPEDASETLLALRGIDEGAGIELAEEIDSDDLSEMLNVMEPDDAADVVADLSKEDATEVLDLMEEAESRSVQELLKYPEETAGGIMTSEFATLSADITADKAIQHLREHPPERQLFYIYVTSEEGKLLGTVSIDKLITSDPNTELADIAVPNVVSVTPETDREETAALVTQYDMLAMPVLDEQDELLGVVTIDDAMDVLREEATEDIYKLAGTSDDELLSKSAFKVAQIRLPWLFVCLAGSLFSGFVIRLFSGTISQAVAIASFIPAIMAMGGNTGLQSSTATVRGIATGYINLSRVAGLIFKEIRTALIMGIACGILMSIVGFIWSGVTVTGSGFAWKGGQIFMGFIVGLSIFIAISLSATMGILIPIAFRRINVDPAVASGPFITMINDITGLVIYLALATILINRLG
jgi:magnesium transporter